MNQINRRIPVVRISRVRDEPDIVNHILWLFNQIYDYVGPVSRVQKPNRSKSIEYEKKQKELNPARKEDDECVVYVELAEYNKYVDLVVLLDRFWFHGNHLKCIITDHEFTDSFNGISIGVGICENCDQFQDDANSVRNRIIQTAMIEAAGRILSRNLDNCSEASKERTNRVVTQTFDLKIASKMINKPNHSTIEEAELVDKQSSPLASIKNEKSIQTDKIDKATDDVTSVLTATTTASSPEFKSRSRSRPRVSDRLEKHLENIKQ